MAPKMSKSKKAVVQSSQSQEPFLHFGPNDGGQGLEQLADYVVDRSNKHGPTILAHASEVVGRGARDMRVFF
jgi:hypothetical protein